METAADGDPGSNTRSTAQPMTRGGPDRRARLYELDRLLDGLEQLNLNEAQELPTGLRKQLAALGLQAPANASFTALIEAVWELQERLLLS